MSDPLVMAILPYAVMVGIAVSGMASITLIVSTFLKSQHLDAQILPRLAEITSSIERNALRIDAHVEASSSHTTIAGDSAVDLYEIAQNLKGNASEVHRLLDEIGTEGRLRPESTDRVRIADLGTALFRAESDLAAVVKKIENNKRESSATEPARAFNEG